MIEASEDYWKAIRIAAARMDILGQGNDIPPASRAVRDAFWDVLESRADREPGEVPDALVLAADAAEARFARVARTDLDKRAKEIGRSKLGTLSAWSSTLDSVPGLGRDLVQPRSTVSLADKRGPVQPRTNGVACASSGGPGPCPSFALEGSATG